VLTEKEPSLNPEPDLLPSYRRNTKFCTRGCIIFRPVHHSEEYYEKIIIVAYKATLPDCLEASECVSKRKGIRRIRRIPEVS